jgi:cardiolipin synthase A/B
VWTHALIFVAGALLATAYFLLKNRRNTPYLEMDLDALPALDDDLHALAATTGGNVSSGNDCRVLQNGALYPAMEADIAAARYTIHLETFVWTKGELERRFVDLLIGKARAGVKVRLLIDSMGSVGGDSANYKRMSEAGVQLWEYCRPRWWNLRRFNHRTHRKLLIVDGAIGYTFGHGIADQWLGDGEDEHHWRDTALRVEGPVVQALQAVFIENKHTACRRATAAFRRWRARERATRTSSVVRLETQCRRWRCCTRSQLHPRGVKSSSRIRISRRTTACASCWA